MITNSSSLTIAEIKELRKLLNKNTVNILDRKKQLEDNTNDLLRQVEDNTNDLLRQLKDNRDDLLKQSIYYTNNYVATNKMYLDFKDGLYSTPELAKLYAHENGGSYHKYSGISEIFSKNVSNFDELDKLTILFYNDY
jgi:hypothetical protein